MQTINLHIEDHLLSQAIQHLKSFLSQHKNSNFTYIDEFGDTIEVINGSEFVIPTKADLRAINAQRNIQEFTSLEDLKKELCIS